MALNGLLCADVPLRTCTLTHSLFREYKIPEVESRYESAVLYGDYAHILCFYFDFLLIYYRLIRIKNVWMSSCLGK